MTLNEPSFSVITDIGGGNAGAFDCRNCTTTGRDTGAPSSFTVPVMTGAYASDISTGVSPPFFVSIVTSAVRRTVPLCCAAEYTGKLLAGTPMNPNRTL